MEALALDVKNYDSFRELTEGGMMTAEEGESGSSLWAVLRGLGWTSAHFRMDIRAGSSISLASFRGTDAFRQIDVHYEVEEGMFSPPAPALLPLPLCILVTPPNTRTHTARRSPALVPPSSSPTAWATTRTS